MNVPCHPDPSGRAPGFSRATGAVARAAALAILVATPIAASPPAAQAGQPPQLGGYWQLDLEKSETLQQKLDEMHRSGGGPGPPGGGWHGGMGGMGGGPPMGGMGGHHGGSGGAHPEGGWHGAGRDSAQRARMDELAHPAMSLFIEPGDGTFVLSERGRTIEVLVLGDAATAGSSIQPDAPHLQAQWKGKRLVAEAVGPRGGRMTQELELADGGKQLVIRTRLEGREGRPPLELKRVYNRPEGDQEPPPASPVGPLAPPAPGSAAPPDSTKR